MPTNRRCFVLSSFVSCLVLSFVSCLLLSRFLKVYTCAHWKEGFQSTPAQRAEDKKSVRGPWAWQMHAVAGSVALEESDT